MRNSKPKFLRTLLAGALTLAILLSYTLGSEYSLISSFAADGDLQFYDDNSSISINIKDENNELGTIWFDGEKFYDSDPADRVGIEYPSGVWEAVKEIEGTDITVTATIPVGAFDRRVGFYANLVSFEEISSEKQELIESNELQVERLELLDMGFKDKQGNDLEPLKPISISFRMKNRASRAKENNDSLLIGVYHISEGDALSLQKVAYINQKTADDEEGAKFDSAEDGQTNSEGGITVDGDDVLASFEVGSFSTYIVSDETSGRVITFDNNENYLRNLDPTIPVNAFNKPTAADTSVVADPGTYIKLPKNKFTYAGHVFRAWTTNNDGTGDMYRDGATILIKEDITLYAQWSDHDHEGWTEIKGDAQGKVDPTVAMAISGKYYLGADVTFTKKWTVPVDENGEGTTLCLNGRKLTGAGSTTERIIEVPSGATLNLEDCNHGHDSDYTVTNPLGGTGTIKTGLITGGKSGAIHVKRGTFNMYGGTIAGNVDSHEQNQGQGGGGAGVIVGDLGSNVDSVFNMYGGSISYNKSENWASGGIRGQACGCISIYGGEISYNSGYFGGGTSCKDKIDFNIYGGIVHDNKSVSYGGGGIHFGSNYVGHGNFLGGIVENNQSAEAGGGVIFSDSSTSTVTGQFTFGNIIIRKNTAPIGAGVGFGDGGQWRNIKVSISGMPYIYENTDTSGNPSDFGFRTVMTEASLKKTIIISGPLSDGTNSAKIGIQLEDNSVIPYAFTSGYETYNADKEPSDYFVPDKKGQMVIKDENGEAQLGEGHYHDGIDFTTAWNETSSLPSSPGKYYLTGNVNLSSTWNVPGGTTYLCLNGYKITGNSSQRVIRISNGSTLNLTDCNEARTHTITSPVDRNSKTIHGGLVTGGSGGIEVNGGTFNLYAGNIAGNNVASDGGGILCQNSSETKVNIYGGKIIYNKSNGGGGARILGGTFNLFDGTISNNEAPFGGGLAPTWGCTFNMTGGVIKNNNATGDNIEYRGGGINLGANFYGVANITGGSIINNSGYGAGLYIATKRDKDATITIGSVKITGNQSADKNTNASGIGSGYGKEYRMSGKPIITGNTVDGIEKNAFVAKDNPIIIVGKMDDNAQVGITMDEPGVFTKGYGFFGSEGNNYNVDPAWYFLSDNSAYEVDLVTEEVDTKGEARLVNKGSTHSHPLHDGLDNSYPFQRWISKDELPTEAGNYYLANNVTLTNTWEIRGNKTIRLCLNNKTITWGDSNNYSRMISVIGDSSGAATLILTNHERPEGSDVDVAKCGNIENGKGGCVFVGNDGHFEMYGGVIKNNIVSTESGGGAVLVGQGGLFTMNDGALTNNTASLGAGGAVSLLQGGTATVTGGEISNNVAATGGGGIFFNPGATLNIAGNPTVLGNLAGSVANNIHLPNNTSETNYDINITGTITNSSGPPLIGITKSTGGVPTSARFTVGYGYAESDANHYNQAVEPKNVFDSDNPDYNVTLYKDGCEAMLSGYWVEYHAEYAADKAKWTAGYRTTSEPDSPYILVSGDTPFYAEEYNEANQYATEPSDPVWQGTDEHNMTEKLFNGWHYSSSDEHAALGGEFEFAKKLTEPVVLEAEWLPNEYSQSYVGGLVGYSDGNITFSGCEVGYNLGGKADTSASHYGMLLNSEGFNGYVGGLVGYVEGSDSGYVLGTLAEPNIAFKVLNSAANSRMLGTYIGGVGGYVDGNVSVSGTDVAGYIIGGSEVDMGISSSDGSPAGTENEGYIHYRTYAGEYVAKEIKTGLTGDSYSVLGTPNRPMLKFYDASLLAEDEVPTTITKVVRKNHRFYQPALNQASDDPLASIGANQASQSGQ